MLSDRAGFRRRRLSMTSLIDVIFLLLLFFMLSSTFSRHGELLLSGGTAGAGTTHQTAPRFLQLAPDSLHLNGRPVALAALPGALEADPGPVLVALRDGVSAQRLADLLAVLRGVPGLAVTVLE